MWAVASSLPISITFQGDCHQDPWASKFALRAAAFLTLAPQPCDHVPHDLPSNHRVHLCPVGPLVMVFEASPSPHAPRAVCPRCWRPQLVCYCPHLHPVATQTRVVIVQHARERHVPINTARIAHECLPNSALRVGVDFAHDAALERELHNPSAPAVLLFPGDDAVDLESHPPPGPVTLVVVDGTWWQAKKLLQKNPKLAQLPRYQLHPTKESRYRIRREPTAQSLATIEALTLALHCLEPENSSVGQLLTPFDAMVERQLSFAGQDVRTRHRPRPRRRSFGPLPPAFRDAPESLVVVVGETNQFPYADPCAPAPELIHWVATRLVDGERFEAVLRPRHALAPHTASFSGLSEEELLGGENFRPFLDRWKAFTAQPTHLLAWGQHALACLERESASTFEALELRAVTHQHLGRKLKTMEACAETLEATVGPVWARGRAGQRLALAEAIASRLLQRQPPRASTATGEDAWTEPLGRASFG